MWFNSAMRCLYRADVAGENGTRLIDVWWPSYDKARNESSVEDNNLESQISDLETTHSGFM